MAEKPRILKIKEKEMLEEYVLNGGDVKAAAEKYDMHAQRVKDIIKSDIGKEFLAELNGKKKEVFKDIIRESNERSMVDRTWKILRLRDTADEAFATKQYSAVISAISELNKMQGDYAPDKSLSFNLEVKGELQQVNELVQKLMPDYKKPF